MGPQAVAIAGTSSYEMFGGASQFIAAYPWSTNFGANIQFTIPPGAYWVSYLAVISLPSATNTFTDFLSGFFYDPLIVDATGLHTITPFTNASYGIPACVGGQVGGGYFTTLAFVQWITVGPGPGSAILDFDFSLANGIICEFATDFTWGFSIIQSLPFAP